MLLIKNGRIKTMASPDLERGCILIDDEGKIAAVGEAIEETAGMTVIDAEGRLVTPGCVEAHCHIGVHNSAMRWEGADFNERSDQLKPHKEVLYVRGIVTYFGHNTSLLFYTASLLPLTLP